MKKRLWQWLLILSVSVTLTGIYQAFYSSGRYGQEMKGLTPEQAFKRWLEKEYERRQPSVEEIEVMKMCYFMSYLTDKVVTTWLKEMDEQWKPSVGEIEPFWPRCSGVIEWFAEMNPPPQRKYVGESARHYVFLNGVKSELVDYPTAVPWSAVWAQSWHRKAEAYPVKHFYIRTKWFRDSKAFDKYKYPPPWPTGDVARHEQIYGFPIAALVRYAIKHASFSGRTIGDDCYFVHGRWHGELLGDQIRWKEYEEIEPSIFVFRKYNFKCIIEIKSDSAIDEERKIIDRTAKLIEAQIIAYSLFGLEKFTVLQTKSNGEDFYLPAGRIEVGSYLVPIGYVIESVTGKRPIYDMNLKQVKVEAKGREEMVRGELIEAANKYFPVPEEERLVTNWEAIQSLLGLRKVQDIRFDQ